MLLAYFCIVLFAYFIAVIGFLKKYTVDIDFLPHFSHFVGCLFSIDCILFLRGEEVFYFDVVQPYQLLLLLSVFLMLYLKKIIKSNVVKRFPYVFFQKFYNFSSYI